MGSSTFKIVFDKFCNNRNLEKGNLILLMNFPGPRLEACKASFRRFMLDGGVCHMVCSAINVATFPSNLHWYFICFQYFFAFRIECQHFISTLMNCSFHVIPNAHKQQNNDIRSIQFDQLKNIGIVMHKGYPVWFLVFTYLKLVPEDLL